MWKLNVISKTSTLYSKPTFAGLFWWQKSSMQTSKAFCRWKWAEWVQVMKPAPYVFVRILNNSRNDWISTWECAILTAGINWPNFPHPILQCQVRFVFSCKAQCPCWWAENTCPDQAAPKLPDFQSSEWNLQVFLWMSLALGSLTGFQSRPKGPAEPGPPSPWAHHHSCAHREFEDPRKLLLVGVILINSSYKGQWTFAAQFCQKYSVLWTGNTWLLKK